MAFTINNRDFTKADKSIKSYTVAGMRRTVVQQRNHLHEMVREMVRQSPKDSTPSPREGRGCIRWPCWRSSRISGRLNRKVPWNPLCNGKGLLWIWRRPFTSYNAWPRSYHVHGDIALTCRTDWSKLWCCFSTSGRLANSEGPELTGILDEFVWISYSTNNNQQNGTKGGTQYQPVPMFDSK